MSERSGLPASSIYWHFKDKDDLIAAVIDRSFRDWIRALDERPVAPTGTSRDEMFRLNWRHTGRALAAFPDFLRLGLMLVLERRPQEATARQKFMEVRRATEDRLYGAYRGFFHDLGDGEVRSLTRLALALADGFLVAAEAEGADLGESFDIMASAILGAADQFATRNGVRP